MDQGTLYGRSISFPPRIGPDGRVLWSEGPTNVRESIKVILLTELEERVMLPEFGCGLKSFLFKPNTLTTQRLIQEKIMNALILWEPRIALESINITTDEEAEEKIIITIRYRLVATGETENVTLTVNLKSEQ
jgi:phage baseplate assembly protein W